MKLLVKIYCHVDLFIRAVHNCPIVFTAAIAGNVESMWLSDTQLDATVSAENAILPQRLEARSKKVHPHGPRYLAPANNKSCFSLVNQPRLSAKKHSMHGIVLGRDGR